MASMMKAAESFVRGARLAVGEEAVSAGTIIATATAASTARPALASHMPRQSLSVATRAADTAMPMPTPEKCSADKPLRPVAASRSSTRAELKIRQAHRRQLGAGEVTHEIGRGDQARLGLAEAERLDHRRQDGGVDEAADSDAGGHRQEATEGQGEGAFVH